MFTGIIENLARVDQLTSVAGGARLVTVPETPVEGLVIGESIANEGACLTAEPGSTPEKLIYFLSDETLKKTTLGDLKPGMRLNMERSLAAGDRLGGHFVMGHVDGVGRIVRLDRAGEGWDLEVEFPESFGVYLAAKGSVAISGISLTLAELKPKTFTVAVIPHTYDNTSLCEKKAGSPVNLEADVIARYVVRFLSQKDDASGVTQDLLRDSGFA